MNKLPIPEFRNRDIRIKPDKKLSRKKAGYGGGVDGIILIASEIIGFLVILSAVFNWKIFRRRQTDKAGRIARAITGVICVLSGVFYEKLGDNFYYWYSMEMLLLAVLLGIEAGGEKK